jgi:acid phosphatase type 7
VAAFEVPPSPTGRDGLLPLAARLRSRRTGTGAGSRNDPRPKEELLRIILLAVAVLLLAPSVASAETYTFIGAGDIATGGSNDTATSNIILGQSSSATVWTAGDNAYPNGSLSDYNTYYAPTWGRFRGRTWPTPGNHEYLTPGAAGYFNYFSSRINGRAYYFKDFGANWRVYFLNSQIAHGVGSAQYNWLRSNLTSTPHPCTIAIWHSPRFTSSANHSADTSMGPFWNLLYAARAELVLNGHNHHYERFAKMRPDGSYDPARGVREVVVGTGGAGLYPFTTPARNSQVRNATTWGVLRLYLDDTLKRYSAKFLPKAGQTFTDAFSSSCSA